MPPWYSSFISFGTSIAQTFKYVAGDSRRTRFNTSGPCCCQSSARSSRKRLLNARRVASGEPARVSRRPRREPAVDAATDDLRGGAAPGVRVHVFHQVLRRPTQLVLGEFQ